MADFSIIASIIGIAGAGFRLSLVLNAVGVGMATADVEIQSIARAVSEYAFTLKQLALTLESAKSIATQSAMETAKQIADQSQLVFDDIKEMTELNQKKDDRGHLQSIAVEQRVRWCFKKQRLDYLLGQLVSLKLSLSIMLQVLQMAQSIMRSREDSSIVPPNEQAMLQERAEIQNMVVVRHWSLVDLHRLYEMAENEATERNNQHRIDIPPPHFKGNGHTPSDPRLQIEGPRNDEDVNKAMVKYNETPIHNLDASLNRALYRPNKLLRAPGTDIVDRLLDEWTRVRGTPPRKNPQKPRKHRPRYDTDSEDSEIDFERGDIGGRYIGAPPRKPRNVHFERARVESGSEDSDQNKPRHRAPRHAILDSDSVSTSTTESDSDSPPPRPPRRFSDGSKIKPAMQEFGNQTRRPYTSGGSPQSSRPISRSGPQPPASPRPGPVQTSSYRAQMPPSANGPGSAGLRPLAPYGIPPGPKRMSSSGPPGGFSPAQLNPGLIPLSPGTSPIARGMYFTTPNQMSTAGQFPQPYPSPTIPSYHKSSKRRNGVDGRGNGEKMTFKQNAKRDVKRGLIGAGAVAGLMDIIEGLGAI
ncbi:MAG: hypothetical protein L6R38_006045 [Xanthoria sp. 2 TBL-2021]|nr:MAG: hypothetical protein L6R38_006045 [Xanthoria sp. 2 TBL-2021]